MNIGDEVMIHPAYSLKFARKWGTIIEANTHKGLTYTVEIDNMVYGFFGRELVTAENYLKLFEVGSQAFNRQTGEIAEVKRVAFPFVYVGDNLEPIPYHEVLTVAECADCREDMLGSFVPICDKCHYENFLREVGE